MKKMILSIIIPAYNVEMFIDRTLDSVLSEQVSDVEVIVVNDGSTDATADVVQSFIRKYPVANLQLYTQTNQGVSAARNAGLSYATGAYVYFLDGDDYLAPRTLVRLLDCCMNLPQIIFWPYDLVDQQDHVIRRTHLSVEEKATNGLDLLSEVVHHQTDRIWMGAVAFERAFLLEHGLQFSVGCIAGEDQEFIYRSLSLASSVKFCQKALTFYLQRAGSAMQSFNVRKFDAAVAQERTAASLDALGTPQATEIAQRMREQGILHSYAGTYRMMLAHLVTAQKMQPRAAVSTINQQIDNTYPLLRERIHTLAANRSKSALPDRISVFLKSPLLYWKLGNLSDSLKHRPVARRRG